VTRSFRIASSLLASVVVLGVVLWGWLMYRTHLIGLREAANHELVLKASRADTRGPLKASIDWGDWPKEKGNALLSFFLADPRAPGLDSRADRSGEVSTLLVKATTADSHGVPFDCIEAETNDTGWYGISSPFRETGSIKDVPLFVIDRRRTDVELWPMLNGADSKIDSLFVRVSGESDNELREGVRVGLALINLPAAVGLLAVIWLLGMALSRTR
jgi:hypothetical protein